jgi:hypothetical protein
MGSLLDYQMGAALRVSCETDSTLHRSWPHAQRELSIFATLSVLAFAQCGPQ